MLVIQSGDSCQASALPRSYVPSPPQSLFSFANIWASFRIMLLFVRQPLPTERLLYLCSHWFHHSAITLTPLAAWAKSEVPWPSLPQKWICSNYSPRN
jgi:hypothetical protein